MNKIEETDLDKAFILWYRNYGFKPIDQEIHPYLTEEIRSYDRGSNSWLERARLAQFISLQNLAQKLQISRTGYFKLEASEKNGTISLNSLADAAEAMNCELVYAVRPKNRCNFSKLIWKKVSTAATGHPSMNSYNKKFRSKSIAAIATRLMNRSEFRKSQCWSQRANEIKN